MINVGDFVCHNNSYLVYLVLYVTKQHAYCLIPYDMFYRKIFYYHEGTLSFKEVLSILKKNNISCNKKTTQDKVIYDGKDRLICGITKFLLSDISHERYCNKYIVIPNSHHRKSFQKSTITPLSVFINDIYIKEKERMG